MQGPVVEPAKERRQVSVLLTEHSQALPKCRPTSDVIAGIAELDQQGRSGFVASRVLLGDVVLDVTPEDLLLSGNGGQPRESPHVSIC